MEKIKRMKEWENERMREWENERMKEWENKRMRELRTGVRTPLFPLESLYNPRTLWFLMEGFLGLEKQNKTMFYIYYKQNNAVVYLINSIYTFAYLP